MDLIAAISRFAIGCPVNSRLPPGASEGGRLSSNGTRAAFLDFVDLVERSTCEDWPVIGNPQRMNRGGLLASTIDDHDQFRAA